MIVPVRRVLAMAGDDGTSGIVADSASPHVQSLPGMPPDLGLTDLWYTGPGAGAPDAADREFAVAPDPGGTLFRVVQFPPDSDLPAGPDGRPELFWHSTQTVDYNIVLSGELTFLADHGEVTLRPGDTIVVAGGSHAWSNRSDLLARLATVSIGDGSGQAS